MRDDPSVGRLQHFTCLEVIDVCKGMKQNLQHEHSSTENTARLKRIKRVFECTKCERKKWPKFPRLGDKVASSSRSRSSRGGSSHGGSSRGGVEFPDDIQSVAIARGEISYLRNEEEITTDQLMKAIEYFGTNSIRCSYFVQLRKECKLDFIRRL